MASKTYKLRLTKRNETTQDISFTIPDTAGTYNLKLNLGGGGNINCGDIAVGYAPNTYQLKLNKRGGGQVVAGTFTTPLVACSLAITQPSNGTISVSRTSSPNASAGTGALANGASIYYGDILSVALTPSSNYAFSSLTINGTQHNENQTHTVSGNVSVSGATVAKSWHTVWTGSTIAGSAPAKSNIASSTRTIAASTLSANIDLSRPTRISGNWTCSDIKGMTPAEPYASSGTFVNKELGSTAVGLWRAEVYDAVAFYALGCSANIDGTNLIFTHEKGSNVTPINFSAIGSSRLTKVEQYY